MREKHAQYYSRYAEALAERFSHGVLKEFQAYNHFVVWKKTPDNKKIPFDPKSQVYARTDTPDSWGNLDQALKPDTPEYFHWLASLKSFHFLYHFNLVG